MNVSTNISIDADTKKEAVEVLNELGLNLSSAVNIFLKQVVREQALPFKLTLHPEDNFNAETLEAFKEVEYMKAHPDEYPGYTDVDKMLEDLLK